MVTGPARLELRLSLLTALRDGLPLPQALKRVKEQGGDLVQALDLVAEMAEEGDDEIEYPMYQLDWLDPVLALIEHLGDADRAQEVLDRTERLRDRDARAHHRAALAAMRAADAIAARAPAVQVLDLLATPGIEPDRRAARLILLGREYPLRELAELPELAPADTELLGRELRKRVSALDALTQLMETLGDPDRTVAALVRFWEQPEPEERGASLRLLDMACRLHRASHVSLRQALRIVDGQLPSPAALPVLRRHGLTASAAALHLSERDGLGPPAVARVLVQAGYDDDDVLRGMLENGLGTDRSLRSLRENAWDTRRMVEALLRRGAMLPEVRDRLDDLGISRAEKLELLTPHASPDVLALVLEHDP